MNRLLKEYRLFLSCPWDMRVLIVTNLIYAFVMPIVELFVGTYIMRQSKDVSMVVSYQLAVYTGIPFTFLLNGFLLRHFKIKRLYSLGMLLSGVSMAIMMCLPTVSLQGVAVAGVLMGMSCGLYWSNRDFLALSSTTDENRNYYYGLETFFATNIAIVVPLFVGAFISQASAGGWFGHSVSSAYHIVTALVFLLTLLSSIVVHRGHFSNPADSDFIYFRYHWLWNRMQLLAILKGLVQGYIVSATAMLVMKLLGGEGTLGIIQSVGGVLSAFMLYIVGRTTRPRHRIYILAVALTFFACGGLCNAALFNATGVILFSVCLLLFRPLHDIAYFPIQMQVIDTVSAIEGRNKYAYIFNQEFGFYVGRFCGCGLFLLLAYEVSDVFALRYSLLIVGAVQMLSILVARTILRGCADCAAVPALPRVETAPAMV